MAVTVTTLPSVVTFVTWRLTSMCWGPTYLAIASASFWLPPLMCWLPVPLPLKTCHSAMPSSAEMRSQLVAYSGSVQVWTSIWPLGPMSEVFFTQSPKRFRRWT